MGLRKRFGEIDNKIIFKNIKLLSNTGLIGRQTPEISWLQLIKLGVQIKIHNFVKIKGDSQLND